MAEPLRVPACGGGGLVGYRAEVDGLRAVAVLAVFGFHAELGPARGGFLGVDVFFVISGFLVTGILRREMAGGGLDVVRFWGRRLRRLLPALLVVLGTVAGLGWLVLMPPVLEGVGAGMAAGGLWGANLLFWWQGSYFDERLKGAVLLHLWSLGVEGQFYLLWPGVVWAAFRWRAWWAVVALAAGGLAFAWWQAAFWPEAAFFLLPGRVWELALGGAVALLPRRMPAWGREGASAVGVGLVVAACALGERHAAGLGWAVVACGGAALVLLGGGGTLAGRGLGLGAWLGRISYPFYLWHWPLLVLWVGQGRTLGLGERVDVLAVLVVALGLAWATWRFVERPKWGDARWGAAGVAWVVAVGAGLVVAGGAPGRFAPDVVAAASVLRHVPPDSDCFVMPRAGWPALGAGCLAVAPGRANVLVFGDSHAAHLVPGLAAVFPGVRFLMATGAQCQPLRGVGTVGGGCAALKAAVLDGLLAEQRLAGVVLAGFWQSGQAAGLAATVAELVGRGQVVTVMGPIVAYRSALPELVALGLARGDTGLADRARRRDHEGMEAGLRAAVEGAGGRYVSLLEVMCPGGRCVEVDAEGLPVQFDRSHLTEAGARLVVRRLKEGRFFIF